jgi:hypothetical protein
MNSPSATRSVVVESAGTARSPRPNVTDTSESSIATGALSPPLSDGTGLPENAGIGCIRIMATSACKRDASKIRLFGQENPRKAGESRDSIWAIWAQNCMQLRRSAAGRV